MDGVSKKKAVSFFAIGFVVGIILTLLLVFSVNFFTKDPAKDVSGKPKTTQTDHNEKAEVTSDEEENLDETTADETTADDEITADTSNDTITESGEDLAQEPIADAVSAASWDSAAAYTGGQKVSYGGKIYEAKWWTQGEAPGKSADGAWNFVSDAKPVETVPDEPEEPD
ncbi:MAG: carbohydrate-binding protein, partial [Oscillospiraceae bacterium]